MTEYENKALFLRKSKKGNHLFAFAGDTTLVMSIEEVSELIDEDRDWVKVSVLEKKDE
jgi:hypothetical protein